MMAQKTKEETAEQKLLKMIEANAGDKPGSDGGYTSKAARPGFLKLVRTINLCLVFGVLCALGFFGYAIKIGVDDLSKEVNIGLDGSDMNKPANSGVFIPEPKRLAFYTEALATRDIFAPYEERKTVVAEDQTSQEVISAIDAYRLVGIAWFDTAESASVMIEDKNQNVTYFLQSGEKLGNIQIKTIYADSAVLGYENEEIIIRYDTPQP